MVPLVKVLVLTSSLDTGLYTTLTILLVLVTPSDCHMKLPLLSLRALCLVLPPLDLTYLILLSASLVLAAGLPLSNFLFFLWMGIRPPVSLLLCLLSLEIPMLVACVVYAIQYPM